MPAYSFKFADPWTGVVQTYERSVTWTKVSLKEAKIRATPKTSSPGETCCQREVLVFATSASHVDFRDRVLSQSWRVRGVLPSRTWGPREMFSWGARTAAFLGAILTVFAGVVVSRSLKSSGREKKDPAAKRYAAGRKNWKVRTESSPRVTWPASALSSSPRTFGSRPSTAAFFSSCTSYISAPFILLSHLLYSHPSPHRPPTTHTTAPLGFLLRKARTPSVRLANRQNGRRSGGHHRNGRYGKDVRPEDRRRRMEVGAKSRSSLLALSRNNYGTFHSPFNTPPLAS